MVIRLAFRNLWRNTRRTLLTVLGISGAVALMLITMSIQSGVWVSMITAAIQGSAGHVVIQADGWQQDRDAEQVLMASGELAARVREAYPGAQVVRRTMFGGLVTSPTGSAAVMVQGIEPEGEAAISMLDDKLFSGAWLDDDRGILMGERLAETLAVGLGDKVVIMAQAGTDEVESRLFRLKGTFHTGNEALDSFAVMVSVGASQELLPPGDPAHQIAVILPNLGKGMLDVGPAERAVADVANARVLPWNVALPTLEEQQVVDERFTKIMYFFMGLILAVGVLNTVLMSVMERVREFGVMLAVGTKPMLLARMIVLEGMVTGALGGLGGMLLAAGPIWALVVYGYDIGEVLNEASTVGSVPLDTVIRGQASLQQMIGMALMVTVLSTVASMYPARKVLQLTPVQAIGHH